MSLADLGPKRYREFCARVEASPWTGGGCAELCGGRCCTYDHVPHDPGDYTIHIFTDEFMVMDSLDGFDVIARNEMTCAHDSAACPRPLTCRLAPSYPVMDGGRVVGVTLDRDFPFCPLLGAPASVNGEFMRAAALVWSAILPYLDAKSRLAFARAGRGFAAANGRIWT